MKKYIPYILLFAAVLTGAAHYWSRGAFDSVWIATDGDTGHVSLTRTAGGGLNVSETINAADDLNVVDDLLTSGTVTFTGISDGLTTVTSGVLTGGYTLQTTDLPSTICYSPATTTDNQVVRFDGTTGDVSGSTTNVYLTDGGYIGINASSPARPIEIYNATLSGIRMRVAASMDVRFEADTSNHLCLYNTTAHEVNLGSNNNRFVLTVDSTERVGVKTRTPQKVLHVVGDITATGGIYIGGDSSTAGTETIDASRNASLGNITYTGVVKPTKVDVVIDSVGDTIPITADVVNLQPDNNYELTSTPTIADGANVGQTLYLFNTTAYTVTLQDNVDLAGSNIDEGTNYYGLTTIAHYAELKWNGNDWLVINVQ